MLRSSTYRTLTVITLSAIFFSPSYIYGQPCQDLAMCNEAASAKYVTMSAGSFGQLFYIQDDALCICGFRVKVKNLNCSPAAPCRAILYTGCLIKNLFSPRSSLVQQDKQIHGECVYERSSVEITTNLDGEVEFMLPWGGVDAWNNIACFVIETQDDDWYLWQGCSLGEDCCPDSWPVTVNLYDGFAYFDDNTGNDYGFVVIGGTDIAGCPGVVEAKGVSWSDIKAIYR